jgi:hypothetical protein
MTRDDGEGINDSEPQVKSPNNTSLDFTFSPFVCRIMRRILTKNLSIRLWVVGHGMKRELMYYLRAATALRADG